MDRRAAPASLSSPPPPPPPLPVSASEARVEKITGARVSSDMVSIKPLTERTFEEDEDSALLSETDGALTSDEEADDKDKSGSHARATDKTFSRVTPMTNRVSRTSLLTTMIHQNEHASTPQNVISRSASIIRRSRTPNYSIDSPPKTIHQRFTQPSTVAGANIDPPLLSPRSSRRKMLAQELTESLRKGLMWEREVKSSAFNAGFKRRQTTADMDGNPCSVEFDHGLQDCHLRGW